LDIIWDLGFGIWNFEERQIITRGRNVEETTLVEKKNPSSSGYSESQIHSG
jgi:hypothetical protein